MGRGLNVAPLLPCLIFRVLHVENIVWDFTENFGIISVQSNWTSIIECARWVRVRVTGKGAADNGRLFKQ